MNPQLCLVNCCRLTASPSGGGSEAKQSAKGNAEDAKHEAKGFVQKTEDKAKARYCFALRAGLSMSIVLVN